MYRKTAKKLLKFIEKSPTAFQAVTEMTKRLDKEGFEELKEEDHWKLKKGGNYYVTRNHSAIIAFSIPQKPVWKFHIMASHSDSPSLKIKENPEIEVENAYIKLNVERYGGMILSPWFDRPLSVAGSPPGWKNQREDGGCGQRSAGHSQSCHSYEQGSK